MPPASPTRPTSLPASGPQGEGPALELLVHGVGGATPQGMLDDPRTVRISGDERAAVFRRVADAEAERHPERYRDRPIPEAYCWSNLTSGNGARALWLLLLPFMVVNLAHWMRPRAAGLHRTTRLYGALVRLVALSLTVLLTAAACEVTLDLFAWQCAGSVRCSEGRTWLGFLSGAQGSWWAQPGRRLAVAAVVPAALVALLWFLSNRTWSAYESQRPPAGEPDASPTDDADADADADAGAGEPADGGPAVRPVLGRPGFWYGRRLVARLRAAHTAAGLLTIAAAVAGAAARHDRGADSAALDAAGRLLEGALAIAGAAVVWVVLRRGRSERRIDARLDRAAVRALPGAAVALLVLSAGYASWSRPEWVSAGTLPGDVAFRVIALAQGALVVALAVAALALHRRARHPRTVMHGLAGPAVAMVSCALGGVMTGGLAQWVGDYLDGAGAPGMGDEGDITGPPVLLSWQASVIPVLLFVLLVPAAVLAVRTWLTARRLRGTVEGEYGAEGDAAGENGDGRYDSVRTRRIAGVRARAALTDAAPWIVGTVSAATLLLGTGAVFGAWISGQAPGRAFAHAHPFTESLATTVQALGSWLIGVGFLLFVTWGRRAYRDASARRTIGILWDVGTFWPRAAHPFAPPCYAERAVPDLTWRMRTWTARTGGRLVISGHSQGSVLAAAAVWQLPAATRRRVALLTYGSPLERLYGRWFPAYFGPAALRGLSSELHVWRNLFRHTDPIGGPVLIPPDGTGRRTVDREALKDPVAYGRSDRHPLPEPVLGHSDYQADPAFAVERAWLLERLSPPVPRQSPH
ncbi:hypothetical protein [Streptomyces sp. PR69]|uniref:hypothetical protein n=1 Tax=Streptomyces sp. PR69 TaxID=2984950 RepID=UPI0022642636|nr:hypothetical protein [Streptomyces sp. PR69]